MSGQSSSSSSNDDAEPVSLARISASLEGVQNQLRRYGAIHRVRFADEDRHAAIKVLVKSIASIHKCMEAQSEQLENLRYHVRDEKYDIVKVLMGNLNEQVSALKEKIEESARMASQLQNSLELIHNDRIQPNRKDTTEASQHRQQEPHAKAKGRREIETYLVTFVYSVSCAVGLFALLYVVYYDVIFDEA
ncbi:hypothetical protein F5Y11DRAFT_185273 [Daldinia sp. FL1419]|nr:hypothetical protein F5Y11DRAFT_185273 [Daldinia sp. FL1419]